MAGEYIRAASLDDVPPGALLGVEPDGHRICLANVDGTIYAVRNNCTHKDFPLSAGELDDTTLTCEWHGAKFDLTSGRAMSLPAIKPVETYDVKIEDGEILVAV